MSDHPAPSITTTQAEVEQFIAAQVAGRNAELQSQFQQRLDLLEQERNAERDEWSRVRAAEAAAQRAETQRLADMIAELRCVLSLHW